MSEKKVKLEIEVSMDIIRRLARDSPEEYSPEGYQRPLVVAAKACVAEHDAKERKRMRDEKFGLPWHSILGHEPFYTHGTFEMYQCTGNRIGRNGDAVALVLATPRMAEMLERFANWDGDVNDSVREAKGLLRELGWIEEEGS